jgi:hypothetical protein
MKTFFPGILSYFVNILAKSLIISFQYNIETVCFFYSRLSHGFIAPRPLFTGPLCPTLEYFPSVISRGTPHLPARESSISEGRKLKRI